MGFKKSVWAMLFALVGFLAGAVMFLLAETETWPGDLKFLTFGYALGAMNLALLFAIAIRSGGRKRHKSSEFLSMHERVWAALALGVTSIAGLLSWSQGAWGMNLSTHLLVCGFVLGLMSVWLWFEAEVLGLTSLFGVMGWAVGVWSFLVDAPAVDTAFKGADMWVFLGVSAGAALVGAGVACYADSLSATVSAGSDSPVNEPTLNEA